MSKLVRRTLITAGFCIVLGLVLLTAGRAFGGRPEFYINSDGIYTLSDRMRMQEYTRTAEMEKQVVDSFDQISIQVSDSNVQILPSEDDNYYAEYQIPLREKDQEPVFKITDGALTFSHQYSNYSFNYSMGIMLSDYGQEFHKGFIRLYIPKNTQLKTTTLSSSDGEITAQNLLSDNLSITAKYGSIVLEQAEGKSLSLKSSDGDISYTDGHFDTVILDNKYGDTNLSGLTAETINIKSSDGDILINDIQSGKMDITNKYGDITGNNIKADTFLEKQSDGSCTITDFDVKEGSFRNTYGTIELFLIGKEQDYNYNLRTKYGNIILNSLSFEEDENYAMDNRAENRIEAEAKDGSIRITTK